MPYDADDDLTLAERRQWLAREIEHTLGLVRDARLCRLPQLLRQRRQRLRQLRKALADLDRPPR